MKSVTLSSIFLRAPKCKSPALPIAPQQRQTVMETGAVSYCFYSNIHLVLKRCSERTSGDAECLCNWRLLSSCSQHVEWCWAWSQSLSSYISLHPWLHNQTKGKKKKKTSVASVHVTCALHAAHANDSVRSVHPCSCHLIHWNMHKQSFICAIINEMPCPSTAMRFCSQHWGKWKNSGNRAPFFMQQCKLMSLKHFGSCWTKLWGLDMEWKD